MVNKRGIACSSLAAGIYISQVFPVELEDMFLYDFSYLLCKIGSKVAVVFSPGWLKLFFFFFLTTKALLDQITSSGLSLFACGSSASLGCYDSCIWFNEDRSAFLCLAPYQFSVSEEELI